MIEYFLHLSEAVDFRWFYRSQVALVVKNLPANPGHIRDVGSIPGSGRPCGGDYGNPLQYSCLGYPHGWRGLTGYSP